MPLNAVEREPVPTRVLNPNASEASCKPKQRSYRKTKLTFFFFSGDFGRGDFVREFYPGTAKEVCQGGYVKEVTFDNLLTQRMAALNGQDYAWLRHMAASHG